MSVSADEVRKVAHLARIAVEDRELPDLARELSDILGWVEQLLEVDVTGVEPMASVTGITLPTREDDSGRPTSRDEVLGNAPDTRDGFYAVPRVVE